MTSNDNNLNNSLENAINMSQEEIEKLLEEQQDNIKNDFDMPGGVDFDAMDLESLLANLEATDDNDIQEISDLLDKAEKNEAVDEEIVELMNKQAEEGDISEYDAMDLFSNKGASGAKLGFFQRIKSKFKKDSSKTKKRDSEVEEPKEFGEDALSVEVNFNDDVIEEMVSEEPIQEKPVKEKKVKEKKVKEKPVKEKKVKEKKSKKTKAAKEEVLSQQESDSMQASEEVLNGSDAIIQELELQQVFSQEEKDSKKTDKKDKKNKKTKKQKGKKENKPAEETEADIPEKGKPKKEKKVKEKKVKEKKVKEKPIEALDMLEADSDFSQEKSLPKKKVGIILFASIMLMFALVVTIYNYSGHANKNLAKEAYEQEDYLQCYQLLYGQHLNENQEVMFHKSELVLKMDMFWKRYADFKAEDRMLESLDRLIQFVFNYPSLNEYATEWNCENIVADTYENVLEELSEEYKLDEQAAKDIANIVEDVDYTRELTELVEKKQAGKLKYPNMLPEEEERIDAE